MPPHCDTLDGPVVTARQALENVNLIRGCRSIRIN
jgi:hypothetical protein